MEEDKIEKKTKQVAKDTARKTGKAMGKLAVKAIKTLIKIIGMKVITIILIVCLVTVALASFLYIIDDSVFDSISDIAKSVTGDKSGEIVEIIKIDDRKIKIEKDELEERVNTWFEENNVSKEQVGLLDDLSILSKFLEAEVVTSYPDLRKREEIGTPIPEGEVQGCVQFHRRMSDGVTTVLEYMDYNEFATKLAQVGIKLDENQTQEQIYFEKDEKESIYKELEDKFTLNEQEELIVLNQVSIEKSVTYSDYAKQEGHVDGDANENSYDIEVTKLNYQTEIQKYTMPFEFCLALLLTTQSYDFCEAVVDLAKDSKIIIDVQDNVTKNVTTETYSFDVESKIERYVKYCTITKKPIGDNEYEDVKSDPQEYNPYPMTATNKTTVDPYKITKYVLENNNLRLCTVQAKTWIGDYNSEYNNITDNPEIEELVTPQADDDSFYEVPDYHGLGDTLQPSLPSNSSIEENRLVIKERKVNKKTITNAQVTTNEYNKINSEVKESPEKFLSLLKVDPNTGVFDVENLKNNSKLVQYGNVEREEKSSPQNSLLSGKQMLYELLSSNSKTMYLEGAMRYLINVYEGKIKAEGSEYFEMYEPEEFLFIDGAWSALWQENYTKEEFIKMVEEYIPPNGFGNKGRSYREYYKKHFVANAENYFDIATSYGLDPMFIFCIGIHESAYGTSNIACDKGNYWGWGAYDHSPYLSAVSFVGDASKGIESVCKGIANNYVSPSGAWYSWIKARGYDPTTIEGIGARYASDSLWAANIKRHITNIFGVTGGTSSGEIEFTNEHQRKIVEWAEKQVGKSKFYSKARGKNFASKNYCAAFVKSAYYEAGLGYISGNAIDIPHPNSITYTSSGQVDYSKIPIGACIVSRGTSSYGHVALYVGNGYVIEAGGRVVVKQRIEEAYGKKQGFLGWGYATVSQNISMIGE